MSLGHPVWGVIGLAELIYRRCFGGNSPFLEVAFGEAARRWCVQEAMRLIDEAAIKRKAAADGH